MHNNPKHSPVLHRRATVTVMIVVVILIISGLVAQFARRAVQERRQVVEELQERQTSELVTAGIRRAQHQHRLDPEWSGETWTPTVGAGSRTNPSEVVITVQDGIATVVARYPVNQPLPIQMTRQARLEEE